MTLPTADEVLRIAQRVPGRVVAIEALWDGDSTGWFLTLNAIYKKALWFTHSNFLLGAFRDGGGDIRLFNGQVPPWPEADLVSDIGSRLAQEFGVPFYFPSPNYPEDECPRWAERKRGYPCRMCGILLLQREPCPWLGTCYQCHLKEKREREEADGSRPHYNEYVCPKCGSRLYTLDEIDDTHTCSGCESRDRLDSVSESDRQAVRDAIANGGNVIEVMKILGWGLSDALMAIHVFAKKK